MAAPDGIKWGSIKGSGNGKGRIGVYVKLTNTKTQTKRHVEIWFWPRYNCSDSSNTFKYNCGTSVTEATTSRGSRTISCTNTSEWSTSNQKKIYEVDYTYDRGKSAKTYKIYASLSGIDFIGDYTMLVNTGYTVPALASYTVAFNANGGSGAPSSQTKYYDIDLKLSTTVPTRSGYTFMGWGISASDTTVDYAAGDYYYGNSAITLYAIWKKTITVTYDANGGSTTPAAASVTIYNATTSGAFTMPTVSRSGWTLLGWSTSASATAATYAAGTSVNISSSVTLYAIWKKTITLTYDANDGSGAPAAQSVSIYNSTASCTITIPQSVPVKDLYDFLGWSTSASATAATYYPGDTLTLSDSKTLYAVWKLAYIKPTITNVVAARCNETFEEYVDDTQYGLVSFDWRVDTTIVSTRVATEVSMTVTEQGSDAEASYTFDDQAGFNYGHVDAELSGLSTEKRYDIAITVKDDLGESSLDAYISVAYYPIDIKYPGHGVSVGGPATKGSKEKPIFDVKMEALFNKGMKLVGTDSSGEEYEIDMTMTDEEYDELLNLLGGVASSRTLQLLLQTLAESTQKSAITVHASLVDGAQQVLGTSAAKIVMSNTLSKTKDAFSADGGGILLNKDCIIEISGNLTLSTSMTTGDIVYVQIWNDTKNIATVAATRAYAGAMADVAVPPIIMSGSKGDHFYMYAYNSTGARGNIAPYAYNRLTVKEI